VDGRPSPSWEKSGTAPQKLEGKKGGNFARPSPSSPRQYYAETGGGVPFKYLNQKGGAESGELNWEKKSGSMWARPGGGKRANSSIKKGSFKENRRKG